MSESFQPYAVYAIKYAHHDRCSRENFLTSDPHDAAMPMDYFVWAIVGNGRTVVVDTGFSEQQARARGRHWLRSPAAGLGLSSSYVCVTTTHSFSPLGALVQPAFQAHTQ